MKENYDKQMLEQLEKNKGKKILLHSCCGPCSSYVIKELCKYLNVTVFYYNPNIEPILEYEKRKQVQIKLIEDLKEEGLNVDFMDCDYDNESFKKIAYGLEHEKEGGQRCIKCFHLRLLKTAQLAKENNYDFFGTTLTVSPHKNAFHINQIGKVLEKELGIPFLISDFKKREGYKKSIEYSKYYDLYRQNYCGCNYSKGDVLNESK